MFCRYRTKPGYLLFTRINNKFGKDYDVDTMVEKFQKKYIDALKENKDMRPITNVDMLIKRLHERDIRLAVASSARREKGIK